MKKHVLIVAIASLTMLSTHAQQFDLSAELRPRYENKHGYQTLIEKDADGSNFISQRTRLNFEFKNKNLKLKVVMQNVRVWGDVGTLSSDDKATALHEAWATYILNNKVSFKLGRQEIVYDDHRIFGNVGWAQQARSHDAFLFKYAPNANNILDVGFALNADSQSGVDNLYSNAAGYKAFQYAWYHGDFDKFGLSLLLLNTGIEYLENTGLSNESQTIDYMQTMGPRLTYKSGKFDANGAVYLQTGMSLNKDVSASYFTGNLGYKINDEFKVGAGIEVLSGKAMDDTDTDVKSFAPLFGTNHKFNGWMDYFYVGNHANNVGLTDIYLTLAYAKNKFSAKVIPHFFSAGAGVFDGPYKMDDNLGTEIDLTIGYKIVKDINLNAGYSKMFATNTMEILKGGDKDENNSWAWVMVTFKPRLFTHTVQ
ncbi:alginate export family protein [Changchengzhania lutea]|uniref:alginate export family protein n=1 Tax=Changchengzhania lutea TaxID=2049305 RepID=UPI00115F30AA|nr:alginate export family protein [Changchengzhania lutea]